MEIVKASKQEKVEAIDIAASLNEWFNEEGLKNLKIDFDNNNLIVAKEDNNVLGFLCYTTYCGKVLLIWMGVRREHWRRGIGGRMLQWLENESKNLSLYSIEVETLPEEVEYEPYVNTRNFYYKNGFKRILYKKAAIEGWDDQIVLEKKL